MSSPQVALTIRLCFGDVHCSEKHPLLEPQLCFFWRMAHVATLSSPCLILISVLYRKMLHHIFPTPHHPRTAAVSPLEQHRNDPGCFHSLLASRCLHCSSAVLLRDLQRYESMKTFKTGYEISIVLDIIFEKYMYTYINKYVYNCIYIHFDLCVLHIFEVKIWDTCVYIYMCIYIINLFIINLIYLYIMYPYVM